MIPIEESAWAAGFFDGEGCVCLSTRTRNRSPQFSLDVIVGQKNPATLHWLQARWGGTLRFLKAPNESWELRWRSTAKVYPFLLAIFPYLKEKRRHVELAFEFIDTIGQTGGVAQPERHALRMDIYDRLQAVVHPGK